VSIEQIGDVVGHLPAELIRELDDALRFHLAW
jgi:hypothetical protein